MAEAMMELIKACDDLVDACSGMEEYHELVVATPGDMVLWTIDRDVLNRIKEATTKIRAEMRGAQDG